MKERTWVPLPEVAEQTEGVISIGNTGMPAGMDLERIEFHVPRLRRGVIGLGGFAALRLSAYDGDTDRIDYQANSVDGSGVGTSAVAGTRTVAESSRSENADDPKLNGRMCRNGTLSIEWNANALSSRLDIVQQYDPKYRVKQLDGIIRREAIRGTTKHNIPHAFRDRMKVRGDAGVELVLDSFQAFEVVDAIMDTNFVSQPMLTIGLAVFSRGIAMHDAHSGRKEFLFDPSMFRTVRPVLALGAASVLASGKLVRAQ